MFQTVPVLSGDYTHPCRPDQYTNVLEAYTLVVHLEYHININVIYLLSLSVLWEILVDFKWKNKFQFINYPPLADLFCRLDNKTGHRELSFSWST